MLCVGLMLAIAKPVHATQSNAEFANWLQTLAKKTHAAQLEQQLHALKKSDSDINSLIEQASEIISQNNDDFNLPEGTASDNLQQILLVEWNQYQNGSAMSAVPTHERVKPTFSLQPHQIAGLDGLPLLPFKNGSLGPSAKVIAPDALPGDAYLIAPLISGIAIGAP